jgi:hypothetical protein
MAPISDGKAEVLIIEGNEVISNAALRAGITLLSQGRASRMAVVVKVPLNEGRQTFALREKYAQLIIEGAERVGVRKEKVEVISAPIPGHPITLAEAQFVVAKLSGEGVRSAILLADGFHTRRSYGLYSQEGSKVGLQVVPYAYFIDYEREDWWQDTEAIGDFIQESAKLAYYVMKGHLALRYVR